MKSSVEHDESKEEWTLGLVDGNVVGLHEGECNWNDDEIALGYSRWLFCDDWRRCNRWQSWRLRRWQ